MKIVITKKMFIDTIKSIQEQIGGTIEVDCHEHCLVIPPKIGSGTMRGANFQNGIGVFVCNFILEKSLEIAFERTSPQPQPLHIHFLMEGSFSHSFNNNDFFYQLNPLMGAITADSTACSQNVSFPARKKINFVCIEIDRLEYHDKIACEIKELPDKLMEVFNDVKGEKPFIYQSNYSVPIADSIKEINENNHKGMVRRTFIESKVLEIMSFIIKQYISDTNQDKTQTLLKQHDIERIIKAKRVLHERLSAPPTILELSKIIGLNQQKLKKGFKQVYGNTINKYQQKIRLERSRLLLVEGSKSIGEIANIIGYSNGSHFSRLFKNKYGMLPKDYQKSISYELAETSHNGNSRIKITPR